MTITDTNTGDVDTVTGVETLRFADADIGMSRDGTDDHMILTGTSEADTITVVGDVGIEVLGTGGDDILTGDRGDDILRGGAGDDTIVLSEGDDLIDGGADIDTVSMANITGDLNPSIDLEAGTFEVSADMNTEAVSETSPSTAGVAGVAQISNLAFGADFSPVIGDIVTLTLTTGEGAAAATVTTEYTVTSSDMTGSGLAVEVDPDSLMANIKSQFDTENPALSGFSVEAVISEDGSSSVNVAGTPGLEFGVTISSAQTDALTELTAVVDAVSIISQPAVAAVPATAQVSAFTLPTDFTAVTPGDSFTVSIDQHDITFTAPSSGQMSVTQFANRIVTRINEQSSDTGVSASRDPATGEFELTGTAGVPFTATISGLDMLITQALSNFENVEGSDLDDVITGDASANVLDGNAGDDQISGGTGDDTIDGGAGDDAIDGGLGDDHLVGGAGDDTYTVDSGDDTIVVGGGTDSLVMGGRMTGAIRTDEDGDGNFDLELTGVSDGEVYTATVLDQTNDGLTNVEIDLSDDGVDNPTSYVIDDTLVIGSDEADTLTSGDEGGVFFGNAGDDLMTGGDGADQLTGNLGDDTLEGEGGDDVIDGGDGVDEAVFVDGTAATPAVSQVSELDVCG